MAYVENYWNVFPNSWYEKDIYQHIVQLPNDQMMDYSDAEQEGIQLWRYQGGLYGPTNLGSQPVIEIVDAIYL